MSKISIHMERTMKHVHVQTRRRPVAAVVILAIAVVGITALFAPSLLWGQTTPEMQQAREETQVVYDLGRFFGYVHGMVTEKANLALTAAQKREIKLVMDEILSMTRIEPRWAAEKLEHLELDVLTPAQLMEVDRRAIAWQESRETTTPGTGAGGGTGTGPLSTYVAGGAFNPIIDAGRTIGQGFHGLYDMLK